MLFAPTLFPRVPHLPTIQGSGPNVYGIGGRIVERCRRGTCVAPDDPAGQRHAEERLADVLQGDSDPLRARLGHTRGVHPPLPARAGNGDPRGAESFYIRAALNRVQGRTEPSSRNDWSEYAGAAGHMHSPITAIWFALASIGLGAIAEAASNTETNRSDRNTGRAVSPSPGPGASSAAGAPERSIEAMTPAQRTNLPSATMVRLASGRVASLGVLRSEHQARLARFAQAASSNLALNGEGALPTPDSKKRPPPLAKLVTMEPIKQGPADYRAFCNAARASGCLYFPPRTTLYPSPPGGGEPSQPPNTLIDEDPLILEPKLCESEGGGEFYFNGKPRGCVYAYPDHYSSTFNPGSPPPGEQIGGNITWTKQCSSSITLSIDLHGAIRMAASKTRTRNGLEFKTGQNGSSCVVSVYIPKRR
jgi:hypothetical protein